MILGSSGGRRATEARSPKSRSTWAMSTRRRGRVALPSLSSSGSEIASARSTCSASWQRAPQLGARSSAPGCCGAPPKRRSSDGRAGEAGKKRRRRSRKSFGPSEARPSMWPRGREGCSRSRNRWSTRSPMPELPTGTVTFLFTDIEGSTRLLEELGPRYSEVLEEHRRVARDTCERHAGVEVDTQGDAFFVAFARASDALAAAEEAQRKLELPVRMGIHTGEPQLTSGGYVGIDVHRAARVCSAAHGRQVVVSETTQRLLDGAAGLIDLGLHRLKDVGELRLYQLGDGEFPPLRSLNQTNVPIPHEPLIGRKKELADVLRLVRVDGARLVTITGPGGMGKTRFAVEIAAELVEDFRDGVWFVDLSAVRDPELVLPTIAAMLVAKVELVAHIGDRQLLLVLDNLEQVIE